MAVKEGRTLTGNLRRIPFKAVVCPILKVSSFNVYHFSTLESGVAQVKPWLNSNEIEVVLPQPCIYIETVQLGREVCPLCKNCFTLKATAIH